MGFSEIVGNTGFWIAASVALLAGFMRGSWRGLRDAHGAVFALLFGPLQTVGCHHARRAGHRQLLPSVHADRVAVIIPWQVRRPCSCGRTWLLVTVDPQSWPVHRLYRAGVRTAAS